MLPYDTLCLSKKSSSPNVILVVEDDVSTAETLALALSLETPHTIFLAATGREAVQTLRESTPHLILLDLHLPDMSGLAFYDGLRLFPEHAETPVVFLSASPSSEMVKEIAHRAGVVLEKPFDLTELLALVARLLPAC